jgi:hypothetical protein
MKPAVMVCSDDLLNPLDPMSRVSFEKVYQIRSSAIWKLRGHVRGEALVSLQSSFNECFQKNFDLADASSKSNKKAVVRLLAEGADPNAVVGIQGNALFEAVRGGHYGLASIFLLRNADPYLGLALEITDSPLHSAIARKAPVLVKQIVRRSICSQCNWQPNQRALLRRASMALAECPDPVSHLRDIQSDRSLIMYNGQRYTLQELREEMPPFCPRMWPVLVYLPPAVIVAYRADVWFPCASEFLSSFPTQYEMDTYRDLQSSRRRQSENRAIKLEHGFQHRPLTLRQKTDVCPRCSGTCLVLRQPLEPGAKDDKNVIADTRRTSKAEFMFCPGKGVVYSR